MTTHIFDIGLVSGFSAADDNVFHAPLVLDGQYGKFAVVVTYQHTESPSTWFRVEYLATESAMKIALAYEESCVTIAKTFDADDIADYGDYEIEARLVVLA